MSFGVGIVGLPNVGKSTLFQAITKKQVDRQNYPFCTIEPNVGVVAVPDERIDGLSSLFSSQNTIYTTIEFYDIAGLIKGAHKGEGLGNQFLAHIREVDAVVYVLRCFRSENIINTQDGVDPVREKETLDTELMLKDLDTVDKRISKLEKESRSGDKDSLRELEVLNKIKGLLEAGSVLSEKDWSTEECKFLEEYNLLTSKPRLYLLNGAEDELARKVGEQLGVDNVLAFDVQDEYEAIELTREEREEVGLDQDPGLGRLIKTAYRLLDLITFITAGEKETRAWTITKGTLAPEAAGVIHSDFQRGFICADVINWQDLLSVGGYSSARDKGLVRREGKQYEVKDGDVIEFKFNV